MSLLLSNFYPLPLTDIVLTTGNQNITGIKTFNDKIITPEIHGLGLAGVNRKINLQAGQLYAGPTNISLDYWNRILSGTWKFQNRPTVNGSGVLLEGEAAAGGIGGVENAVYTTGDQNIGGNKTFDNNLNINAQLNLRANSTNSIPTHIPVFISDPSSNTTNLVTRTSSQIRSDIGANNASNLNEGTLNRDLLPIQVQNELTGPFNGSRPIRRIPVNNTNYGGNTISGFLNNLFFPYTNATVNISAFSVKNYGYDTIGSETFAGQLNSLDDNITGIACLYDGTILRSSMPPILDGNNNYSITNVNFIITPSPIPPSRQSTSSELFKTRIFGIRNGTQFTQDSNNIRLRFEPPYFYGISNNDNLQVQVTGLTRVNASTYLGINGSNYSVNGRPSFINGIQFQFNNIIPNGYIYFAYPDFQNSLELINNWGLLATSAGIVDAVSFADYSSTYTNSTVQINFPTRSNITYRIYRSPLITPVSLPTTFTLNFKFV